MSRKIDGITVNILRLVLSDGTSQSQAALLLTEMCHSTEDYRQVGDILEMMINKRTSVFC